MIAPSSPTRLSLPLGIEDQEHVLHHTSALWEEQGPALRLFVTGGTGFFGCWLLETFAFANTALHLDARLAVLTRDPEAFRRRMPHLAENPAITLVQGDVRAFDAVMVRDQLVAKGWPQTVASGFDMVLHAATAAGTAFTAGNALGLFEAETDGTRCALAFARATGVRRFLFTSSGAVYGPQPDTVERLAEDHPGGPDPMAINAAYAEGKRVAEFLCACAMHHDGLAVMVARAFAFVGPHLPLDGHFAIGNFLGDRLAGRSIHIKGNGRPVRSYLYAADLAVWLWTILFRGTPGRAYNVGSEEACTLAQTAALVAEADLPGMAPATVSFVGDQSSRPTATLSSDGRYVPSTRRAREELGLRQHIFLPDAIRRTLAWARSA